VHKRVEEKKGCVKMKRFFWFGRSFEFRHDGALPATVPEWWNSSEKMTLTVARHFHVREERVSLLFFSED